MELKLLEGLLAKSETEAALPEGMLRALILTENGTAQNSRVSFAYAPLDPFARRVEPAFFDRYIVGTAWEKTEWGAVPEVVAASFGLAQIMYTTAHWAWGRFFDAKPEVWDGVPWTLFAPRTNLRLAAAVLSYKARRFGGWEAGVAAYNAGSPRKLIGSEEWVNEGYVRTFLGAWGRHEWPELIREA